LNKSLIVFASFALTLMLNAAMPVYGMGNGNGNNGNGNGNGGASSSRGIFAPELNTSERGQGGGGQSQQRRQERELQAVAREERKEIKKLTRRQLEKEAEDGGRLAQMVLAEELADEAQLWVDIPSVANDALSEAIQWYATAAKRGIPGGLAIDNVIAAPVIRAVKSAP